MTSSAAGATSKTGSTMCRISLSLLSRRLNGIPRCPYSGVQWVPLGTPRAKIAVSSKTLSPFPTGRWISRLVGITDSLACGSLAGAYGPRRMLGEPEASQCHVPELAVRLRARNPSNGAPSVQRLLSRSDGHRLARHRHGHARSCTRDTPLPASSTHALSYCRVRCDAGLPLRAARWRA